MFTRCRPVLSPGNTHWFKVDSDYTVITLWLDFNEKFFLIDMRREQWPLTIVCSQLMDLSRHYQRHGIYLHLIEKTANGPEIIK